MEQFTVHKVHDNLLISLEKLPGFGKAGVVNFLSKGETLKFEVYYAGGFFKRCSDAAVYYNIQCKIMKLITNMTARKAIPGHVVDISFTSAIRKDKAECLQSNLTVT